MIGSIKNCKLPSEILIRFADLSGYFSFQNSPTKSRQKITKSEALSSRLSLRFCARTLDQGRGECTEHGTRFVSERSLLMRQRPLARVKYSKIAFYSGIFHVPGARNSDLESSSKSTLAHTVACNLKKVPVSLG